MAKDIHDFSSERKKLPFFGNPTKEELFRLSTTQKENRHLVSYRWNYISNDSFTTYKPGLDALVWFGEIEDDAPTGMGILAWYLVPIFDENDKRTGDLLEPAYIGNFKDGRFHGYGILFASSLGGFFGFGDISGASPINSNSGIFYEGEFVKGKFNGKGIAYVSTTSVRVRNEKEYNAVVDLTMERGQKIADKFYILSGEFNDGKFED